MKALVVGSTNVDQVVLVPGLPRAGETVLSPTWRREPGGKGANQAVALARLGASVSFVSAVGDDEPGRWSLDVLLAAGLSIEGVAMTPAPTGQAIVMVDPQGENCIVVSPGANLFVTAPISVAADVVLLSLEVPLSTVTAVAVAASAPVVLNAAPAQPLPLALLEAIDVLIVNETEWSSLGEPSAAAVVVTLGGRGCRLLVGGEWTDVPGVPVEVVDTTGAGDCFAAALTYGVGLGWPLPEAAAFANRAAALSVTRAGARGGLPTLAEVRGTS